MCVCVCVCVGRISLDLCSHKIGQWEKRFVRMHSVIETFIYTHTYTERHVLAICAHSCCSSQSSHLRVHRRTKVFDKTTVRFFAPLCYQCVCVCTAYLSWPGQSQGQFYINVDIHTHTHTHLLKRAYINNHILDKICEQWKNLCLKLPANADMYGMHTSAVQCVNGCAFFAVLHTQIYWQNIKPYVAYVER